MDDTLEKAFEILKQLPEEDRERFAWEIIERVEDKTEWDRIVTSRNSQRWLKIQAKMALRVIPKSSNKLSFAFLTMPQDKFLREESYWQCFDQLPIPVKQLAEKNYQLWKANPHHPGLRFKKVHDELAIFSFRVGMMYRTLGVEADDGEILWFWIGSLKHFERQIKQ